MFLELFFHFEPFQENKIVLIFLAGVGVGSRFRGVAIFQIVTLMFKTLNHFKIIFNLFYFIFHRGRGALMPVWQQPFKKEEKSNLIYQRRMV